MAHSFFATDDSAILLSDLHLLQALEWNKKLQARTLASQIASFTSKYFEDSKGKGDWLEVCLPTEKIR